MKHWLASRLDLIWYTNKNPPLILRLLAYLHAKVLAKHEKQKPLRPKSSPPVIVVGNLTVGGTGKSPLVIYITELLSGMGYKPAIISRGYGGKAKKYPLLLKQDLKQKNEPQIVGDEPSMLRQQTKLPIVIDPNRTRAVEFLTHNHLCDVIVSDDGLQHTKLWRDIEIISIDGIRGFGNEYLLPAGPLRSKLTRLKKADALIITGGTTPMPEALQNLALPIYRMQMQYQAVVDVVTDITTPFAKWVEAHKNQKIHAIAAIGNPKRFFEQLTEAGLNISPRPFLDHHNFKPQDLAFAQGSVLLMTHKDAVKCKGFLKTKNTYYYVEARAKVGKETTNHTLDYLLKKLLTEKVAH